MRIRIINIYKYIECLFRVEIQHVLVTCYNLKVYKKQLKNRGRHNSKNTTEYIHKYLEREKNANFYDYIVKSPKEFIEILEKNKIKKISIFPVNIAGPSYPMYKSFLIPDNVEPHEINLQSINETIFKILPINKLVFKIDSIYKGTKYNDICISGMQIRSSMHSDYKPTKNWEILHKSILENIKYWDKSNSKWYSDFILSEDYKNFFDLLFYAMNKNEDAQKLFTSYRINP